VQHIVYVVDESVRGDYIQLNNNEFNNTPFLSGLDGRLINFGVATSAANCSHDSRTTLMLGTSPNEQNASHLEAGIFQYAKRAGFRTVVIDGWKVRATYMDSTERSAIDVYLPVTDEPPYLRDNHIAERVLEFLADNRPTFVFVSKFGAHFPYNLDYPSASKSPSRLAVLLQAIMNFSRRLDVPMDSNKRDALVKSYSEAIKWSVDGFFQRLQPHLELNRTLLLYTSDHGQTMWEEGYKNTHCSSDPHPGEYYVPLFALTEASPLEARLRQGAAYGFNRASHFDIFPTLLLAMGYKEKWVNSRFGSNLFDIPLMRHPQVSIRGPYDTHN
jgi:lipid A ethanolaminephosphotransferase